MSYGAPLGTRFLLGQPRSEADCASPEPDTVGEALPEGPGRRLDAGRVAVLRVAGHLAVQLAEVPERRQRQIVAVEVQQRVEQCQPVTRRQYEAVAVGPLWAAGVVLQKTIPEDVGHWGCAEQHTRMAAAGFFHSVGG